MDDAAFDSELQEHIARIRQQSLASPDLLGFELAFDRGNIDQAQWSAVQEQADRCQRLIDQEVAHIEELAARYPAAFDRHLAQRIAQLERVAEQLHRDAATDEPFKQRFTRSLLPDLLETLAARQSRRPARHALSWALWVSGDLLRDFPAPT
jgi:hypothetical protein